MSDLKVWSRKKLLNYIKDAVETMAYYQKEGCMENLENSDLAELASLLDKACYVVGYEP